MTDITILKSGPFTTIQDQGRFGVQHLGVPRSGVLDHDALIIGNHLLGNKAQTSAFEICFGGFEARFDNHCHLTLTGSSAAKLQHLNHKGQQTDHPAGTVIKIAPGDIITIPPFGDSLSVLLCVSGGIDVPAVYGSCSTTTNARLGGHEGRILQASDILKLGKTGKAPPIPSAPLPLDKLFAKPTILRLLFGPQDHWFTSEALANLSAEPYQILPQTSRMGMRLAGPSLPHKGPADIISDAMMRGTIQVPADGQPIIAMADHGTMGGYCKIGTIISADLSALGRLRPHDKISFEVVTMAEAQKYRLQHQQMIDHLLESLAS
ncbi:MAG: biotin-dependent carboxyltransferase family protein [Candidatus Puniceispirillaceae bacterium]